MHHIQTCLTRNTERASFKWKHRALSNKMKIYKSIKLIGKGKYIVKLRIPYHFNGDI